jgi:hypothetical protein
MRNRRGSQLVLLAAWLAGAGCTTLREVPRSEYAARTERKNVRITTREGLEYEFDFVRVESDTLIGFRERTVEGVVPEMAVLRVAMDDVSTLSVRGIDWYRSGLVGGGVLAALVAAGLAGGSGSDDDTPTSGGGPGRIP